MAKKIAENSRKVQVTPSDSEAMDEAYVEKIFDNLQLAMKVESIKDVAVELGLSASAIYNRRSANTVPYKQIIDYCNKHQISVDSIFSAERSSSGDLAIDIGTDAIRLQVMKYSIGSVVTDYERKKSKNIDALNLPMNSEVKLVFVNKSDAFPSICKYGDPVVIKRLDLEEDLPLHNQITDGDILLLVLNGHLVLRKVFRTPDGLSFSTEHGQATFTSNWTEISSNLVIVGRLEHALQTFGAGQTTIDLLLMSERAASEDVSSLLRMPSKFNELINMQGNQDDS